ncbi:MAG TPA: Trp biosynthesis-associated membrane protein, partial [Streptosporangiaceae bacterium]|nr:Trp biosynthesis-associated membrane protein [Streptosporangiaceae bacterium]
SAQDLRPAVAALAVAALASLAAVLATRGLLRRLTGLVTIALGAGTALLGAAKVTPAAVLAAAGRAGAASAGAGAAAGSATAGSASAGSGPGTGVGALAGFGSRVRLDGSGWQVLIIAGAALIIAAGIVIVVRSGTLPAMSGRYDRPPDHPAGPDRPDHPAGRGRARPASESMWESLSAGADPTVGPP